MNVEKLEQKSPSKSFSLIYYSLFASLVVIAITAFLYWHKFSGNITGFFRIGSELPLSPYLNPENTYIFQGELGYDGQQFLSIALDPFLHNKDTLAALDHPSYRYRRIFYPLLSYVLAFGNLTLIPYIMVGINCLSIILLTIVTGRYFQSLNLPKWQCLYVLFIPGVWMVLSLSTADLLSSLLAVTAIYSFYQRKPVLTAFFLAFGCLTRETLILVWIGILAMSWLKGQKKQILYLVIGLIPTILWNLYIMTLNLPNYTGVSANFGFPLVGIGQKFLTLFSQINGAKLFEAYMWFLLLAIFGAIIFIYWQTKPKNRLLYGITLLYGGMFACSSLAILNYYLDYSRVYMDVYFLLLLTINSLKIPIKTILMFGSGLASFAFLLLHS